jgi:hypothetical protein
MMPQVQVVGMSEDHQVQEEDMTMDAELLEEGVHMERAGYMLAVPGLLEWDDPCLSNDLMLGDVEM